MPNSPFVIASAASLFIPAALSIWQQSVLVTLVLTYTALYSTLTQVFPDSSFAEVNKVWSTIGIMLSLILLALVGFHYSIWHWRVMIPMIAGLLGTISYGLVKTPWVEDNILYESLWYSFTSVMFIMLMITPVNLSEAVTANYATVFRRLWFSFKKPPVVVNHVATDTLKTIPSL